MTKEEINKLSLEELKILTKANDVRNWSKDKAVQYLFKSETTYLVARGWHMLCGIPDKYYVAPGEHYPETTLYSHIEALNIQKMKDQENG